MSYELFSFKISNTYSCFLGITDSLICIKPIYGSYYRLVLSNVSILVLIAVKPMQALVPGRALFIQKLKSMASSVSK